MPWRGSRVVVNGEEKAAAAAGVVAEVADDAEVMVGVNSNEGGIEVLMEFSGRGLDVVVTTDEVVEDAAVVAGVVPNEER